MKLSTLRRKPAVTITGLCLMLVLRPAAQSAGSFSDLNIEYSELKVAIESVLADNKQLRDALAETAKTLADTRQNFSEVNGESAIFKRQAMQMKLRMDALGVDTVSGGNPKLEQRLLAAVNDIRASASEKAKLSEALVRLVEAAGLYVQTATAGNAESRLTLESEIRNANAMLGAQSADAIETPAAIATITDSMVVSVKDDLALVVMNVGLKHGVKLGMPFQIVRNGKLIGSVRVVDVREKIAGAVIQDLSSEKDRIKVGDRLKVDARQ